MCWPNRPGSWPTRRTSATEMMSSPVTSPPNPGYAAWLIRNKVQTNQNSVSQRNHNSSDGPRARHPDSRLLWKPSTKHKEKQSDILSAVGLVTLGCFVDQRQLTLISWTIISCPFRPPPSRPVLSSLVWSRCLALIIPVTRLWCLDSSNWHQTR